MIVSSNNLRNYSPTGDIISLNNMELYTVYIKIMGSEFIIANGSGCNSCN